MEFERYLASLDKEMISSLSENTPKIYERCDFENYQENRENSVQIVVGEVQSGKTSSFTALMALARDKGIPLIVVIGGTKKLLLKQTRDRLISDLAMEARGGVPPWVVIDRPTRKKAEESISYLENWLEGDRPHEFKSTQVLMVLKSPAGIKHCTEFFEELAEKFLISDFPVLLIDDEADQAGLNSKAKQNDQSTIYRNILRLRSAIPKSAYCMYTATPQANFLINLIDELSPTKVTLLKPGKDYIGGQELFGELNSYVKEIPSQELNVAIEPDPSDSPPESLKSSLAFYLVALAISQKKSFPKPLSMLIHPSGRQDHHRIYLRWTKEIFNFWHLQIRDQDPTNRFQFIKNTFEPAVKEMNRTSSVRDIFENLDELVNYLNYLFDFIEIRMVNGISERNTVNIDEWEKFPGWILIGGNKLDRGFTVQNLAVTYMPRPPSANADTLQQRGRFFGYKRKYSEYLRGWFASNTAEMFFDYVVHEKAMQSHLENLDNENVNLQFWRRKFILPNGMNATRDQVVSILTNRFAIPKGFYSQRRLFDSSVATGYMESLEKIISFFKKAKAVEGDFRLNRNKIVEIETKHAIQLLLDWIAHPKDRVEISKIAHILSEINKSRQFPSHLYFMDNLETRERSRAFDTPSDIKKTDIRVGNLFTGRQFTGNMYPGDTAMRETSGLTIQIHNIHPSELPTTHRTLAIAIAVGEDLNFNLIEEAIN